ncbi:MAG TPA: MarR family transcriptional regulator [Opitutaceae bacterium]|nr:MarR family transcriptional regulator [Opitutaceae bacterium]
MNALSPPCQRFVLHWGEMGTRWGINRTMAQIHALLYLSDRPLAAEDIANALGVARSNVSTSLRELQNWRIVRLVHLVGDKRDHFEALHDVWEMFRLILNERISRELDPTRDLLRRCLADGFGDGPLDPTSRKRLLALAEFFEVTSGWYAEVSGWPQAIVVRFLKLGGKVRKLLTLRA